MREEGMGGVMEGGRSEGKGGGEDVITPFMAGRR